MPDYQAMYFRLAAKVADVVELLIAAQQEGEESYISEEQSTEYRLMVCNLKKQREKNKD